MTVSVNTSGSQTASIGTEHTLATISSAGTYQMVVDTANLASGATPDIVFLNIYTKCRSTDTERLFMQHTLIGAQNLNVWASPPFGAASTDYVVKLKQSQGTGRAFPWAVYQY
jgi:hypothetical protein